MTAIYVKEQGAQVGRRGERLTVRKGRQTLEEIPFERIDKLVVMGNITVTTPALDAMTKRDIRVVYLTVYGTPRFDVERMGSSRAGLKRAQYQVFGDDRARLPIAQAVIVGKINNQRTILQRQTRRVVPLNRQLFQKSLAGMQSMKRSLERARTLDELRGFEGKAAAWYFEAIRSILPTSWRFQERNYYPPKDPFNALLSFLYSLVQKDVLAAVNIVGLDPGLGFFHEVRSPRPSLPLDLMEEWRPVVADALALELVNNGILTPDQFEPTTARGEPSYRLGEANLQKVIEAYERRMATKQYHPMAGTGGNAEMRYIMRLQAQQIAQLIREDRQAFEPYVIR